MASTESIAIIAYFLDPTEPYFISPLEILNVYMTRSMKIENIFE